MKKILIVGASILQLPAIKKAKEMGLCVAVADYNPKSVGISFADKYYNASTIDIDAICKVAEDFRPDGIMTLATDMPMRSVAAATSMLGLPGISMETAIKATDKGEMIKSFKQNNVPSPWYYIINSIEELAKYDISYPCIIKPTDNAGSRGVYLAHDEQELTDHFAYSQHESRSGQVIIEEYLTGNEVSVEILVVGGKINILAITDKLTTGAPHFVEMGHSQPSRLPASVIDEIINVAIMAIKAIGIETGPAHVEMMVTSQGVKMIELGARMGGDCITTHLVPLSTGIDMIRATIDLSLGLDPDISVKFQKGSAIRFFKTSTGILRSITGIGETRETNGIIDVVFTKSIGEKIENINSSIDRIGYVISQAQNAEYAIRACSDAMKKITIEIN